MLLLVEKTIMKEAWETLKTMYLGTDRVKEMKVQTLKSEFVALHMKPTQSIDDFVVKLTTIVNNIRGLGDTMEESTVSQKFLCVAPNKFNPIVSTIEKFMDMKTMSIEEVIGQLKAHEKYHIGVLNGDNDDEHVLLTRVEWKVEWNAKESSEGSTSKSPKWRGKGGSHGHGRGRGHGRGSGRDEDGRDNDQGGHKAWKFN